MLNRIIFASIFLIFILFSLAMGQIQQAVEISSSPNPVGSGARALGMGGAFIGVADDATAASWNPAGLIQLETPEISIAGAYNKRIEDTSYTAFPMASGPQDVASCELNYLSAAYPFTIGSTNLIVSLNLQQLYDFNKKVAYNYNFIDTIAPVLNLNNTIDYSQNGTWMPVSPAFAVQISPRISLGMTFNIWDHGIFDNQWGSNYNSQGTGTFAGLPFNTKTTVDEKYAMDGLSIDVFNPAHCENINFNLGMLWEVKNWLTIGVVFKSPFRARLHHNLDYDSTVTFPTFPASDLHSVIHRSEMVTLDMPMSYGMGLAFRPKDTLTLDLDVYRTLWSDYVLHDADGNNLNPITGKLQKDSNIKDTLQVRLGGEYLIISQKKNIIVPLRAGIFYDPEPADGRPDHFFGISIGSGIAYKRFVYDIAYQYRFGTDVRSTTVGSEDSSQDVDQHTIYTSVIYHF
ncbi:MAG: outer membrane protein transport protein [Pseudomonadota bacterium]